MTWGVKISNFIVLGVTGTQNGTLLAKKWDFWAKKKPHFSAKRGPIWVPITLVKWNLKFWPSHVKIKKKDLGYRPIWRCYWFSRFSFWAQNGPLLAKKCFFFCPKKISCIFSESSFQNLMFDTKTNLLSFVDAKIWSFQGRF